MLVYKLLWLVYLIFNDQNCELFKWIYILMVNHANRHIGQVSDFLYFTCLPIEVVLSNIAFKYI